MVFLFGPVPTAAAQNLTLRSPFTFVGTATFTERFARARFEGAIHGPSPNISLKGNSKDIPESSHTAYLFAPTTTEERNLIGLLKQTTSQDIAFQVICQLLKIEDAPRPFSFIVLNTTKQDQKISWFFIGEKKSPGEAFHNLTDISAKLDATNRESANPALMDDHLEEPNTCATTIPECIKVTFACLQMLEVVLRIAGASK